LNNTLEFFEIKPADIGNECAMNLSQQLSMMSLERRRHTLDEMVGYLVQAEQYNRVDQLLLSGPEWMEVKFRELGSERPYLDDLQLVSESLISGNDADLLLRLVQLNAARLAVTARINMFADEDLGTLVNLGRAEEALDNARLCVNPEKRASALRAVVVAHIRANHSFSESLLNELRSYVFAIDERVQRLRCLLDIVADLRVAGAGAGADGFLDTAVAVAETVLEPKVERSDLAFKVWIVPDDGDPGRHLVSIPSVSPLGHSSALQQQLARLGESFAAARRFSEAEVLLDRLPSAAAVVLGCALSLALAEAGDTPKARYMLERIATLARSHDYQHRAMLLTLIAGTVASVAGREQVTNLTCEVERALAGLADETKEWKSRLQGGFRIGYEPADDQVNIIITIKNLGQIAAALVDVDQQDLAMQTLELATQLAGYIPPNDPDDGELMLGEQPARYEQEIVDGRVVAIEARFARQPHAMAALAEVYARCGDFDEAVRIAEAVHDDQLTPATFYAVAKNMIAWKQLDGALALAVRVGKLPLTETATGLTYKLITQYMEQLIPVKFSKVNGAAHIRTLVATALVEAGSTERAKHLFLSAEADDERLLIIRRLAADAAQRQDPNASALFTQLREILEKLHLPEERDTSAKEVALALARVEAAEEAARVADSIIWVERRAITYLEMAQMIEAKRSVESAHRQATEWLGTAHKLVEHLEPPGEVDPGHATAGAAS
jgi:hypothetical protein